MKYLVMKTVCDNVYYEGDRPDLAFVRLTDGRCREVARRYAQVLPLARADPNFCSIEWWDDSAVWIAHPTAYEKPWPCPRREEELENDGHVVLKSLGKAAAGVKGWGVHCSCMSVDEAGVRWTCYLKHSDVKLRTYTMLAEVFRG